MKTIQKFPRRLVKFVFCVFLLAACQQKEDKKITIATAANMHLAMEALTKIYSKKYNVDCELVVGSSGKLTAQILEGAPYDLFVAANMKYPEAVFKGRKAMGSPKVYANGKLVLWSMDRNIPVSITALSDPIIEHIALANPKTAPYGYAAIEVLQHHGLYDALSHKFVFGESIGQTDQFISSQAAQIGFTALSTVLSPEMKGKGKWVAINQTLYSNISQGVVLIDRGKANNGDAQDFYEFLFSEEANEVLKEFGYLVNE